jgi:hypothetical protein
MPKPTNSKARLGVTAGKLGGVKLDRLFARFGGRFWRAPAFLPYVQPKLTDARIAKAEAELGVRLPPTYLAMLRQQNGGYVRSEGVARVIRGIGPRFPNILARNEWWRPDPEDEDEDDDDDDDEDEDDDDDDDDEWAPKKPELLVSFDGDGHWDLCFDYRDAPRSNAPAITLVSHEDRSDERQHGSFEEHLAAREDPFAGVIRLYGEITAVSLAKRVTRELGARTEKVSSGFDHGYPVWGAELPDGAGLSWSSNVVPAGYDRKGRRVVATKKTALQLAEEPGCKLLVMVSGDNVVGRLRDIGLDARTAPRTKR